MNLPRLTRALMSALALIVGVPSLAGSAPLSFTPPAAIVIASLTPSPAAPQKVGTTVTWTASATGGSALEYQFSVAQGGRPAQVVRDFAASSKFNWTPLNEAQYLVTVKVQDASAPGTISTLTGPPYRITTRVVGGAAVITPTANPLVFLYSAPPCPTGHTIAATFGRGASMTQPTITPARTCDGATSANWYLGGMIESTTYGVAYQVSGSPASTVNLLTTGPIPAGLLQPTFSVPVPATSATSLANDVVVYAPAGFPTGGVQALATNLSGKIIWYYDPANYASIGTSGYVSRPIGGLGTVLLLLDEHAADQPLREIDLAGNTLRETSVGRINEQLAARGDPDRILAMHHEVNRLPNGHTLFLSYVERLCPNPVGAPACPAVQGGTAGRPVDILGDLLIDLDANLQIAWTWKGYDHLDLNRGAVLGETCANGQPGCPGALLKLASIANDWTHTNTITYSPIDHNLLLSMRHQDWILKIDYQDGAGTGDVKWHLGKDGDFTLTDATGTGGPFPYQSHQHGIELSTSGTTILTFDNGNTRCEGLTGCNSRGQQYTIDEASLQATLTTNFDMGNYSLGLGWAQTLRNGDFSWTSGAQRGPSDFGQDEEFSRAGTRTFVIQKNDLMYRAYRMHSLYTF